MNKYDVSRDDQHHLLLYKLCDPYNALLQSSREVLNQQWHLEV